jgi:hypothetical protein
MLCFDNYREFEKPRHLEQEEEILSELEQLRV